MDNIIILIILALEVEAIWETLKMVWQEGKIMFDRIGALFIGLLIAFGVGIGINELIGIQINIPYLDIVLTGILISRGSNFIHDLITKISNNINTP